MERKIVKCALVTSMLLATSLWAQQQPPVPAGPPAPSPAAGTQIIPANPTPAAPGQAEPGTMEQVRSNYVLGPNDQILIRAFGAEEMGERPYRIDSEGNVDLPLVGTVKAGGLSVDQLEAELGKRLATYVRNPQVSVTVVQYRSEPVFFVGAFAHPGIFPLQGRRTLVDMLASVGGLLSNASHRITITRSLEYGPIPLPNAVVNKANNTSSAEISMGSLRDNLNPAEDILLQPYDQIQVARSELVYVGGEVAHSTGVELGERDYLSVIQLLSLAGGLTRDADAEKAWILRPVMNTSRRAEIPINIKLVLAGKRSDFLLAQNDMLYVPRKRSVGGTIAKYAPYLIGPTITGIVIATR